MPDSKSVLISRLNRLTSELIIDRVREDIDALIELYKRPLSDMTDEEKQFILTPQKGAYNYTDRNRVSEFCNTFVELMSMYYGINTSGYTTLPTNWENITDPTKDQLKTYIDCILIVRDKWYSILFSNIIAFDTDPTTSVGGTITYVAPDYSLDRVYGSEVEREEESVDSIAVFKEILWPVINQIYDGITLETANNIEKMLQVVYTEIRDHMLILEPLHCGHFYGPNSSSVISCGMPYLSGVNYNL